MKTYKADHMYQSAKYFAGILIPLYAGSKPGHLTNVEGRMRFRQAPELELMKSELIESAWELAEQLAAKRDEMINRQVGGDVDRS